ncbi:MAG TPA: hypothetical protein VHL58_12400 [Thermoanaerobaculia bacterium]|nr:hypothetical protein [Thermoanaerobaculia bacterium]
MSPEDDYSDEYERAAAGQEFDDTMKEKASEMGSRLAEGPEALLADLEELLPESWREQIQEFPIVAMVLGVGIGVFLGMRKGDELLAAGASLVTSAVAANFNSVLGGKK